MQHSIRLAQKKDMKTVLELITELAVFEKEPDAVTITEDTLINLGTGDNPLFTCFVAEYNDKVVGAAIVYFRFSTWNGKSLHLEDLIVREDHRGLGIGKALYNQVMLYGKEQGVGRVEWVVLDWNKNAIDFYEKTGVTFLKDWHLVQMNKEQLNTYVASIN